MATYYKASGLDLDGKRFVRCDESLAVIRSLPMLRGKVWMVADGVRRLLWQK